MKAAYLLNNHIIFDSTRSELHVNQQVIVLQELENTLLTLFVTNPEEIISKEALFSAGWKGRYASDNSLNRVISTLRTKLGDNSKSPKFIKTVPKKGYSFIAPVEETTISDPEVENTEQDNNLAQFVPPKKSSFLRSRKVTGSVFFFTLAIVIITLTSTIFLPAPVVTTAKVARITSLTTLQGVEILPAISPSGQYVAFSHQRTTEQFYNLLVKPLHGPSKVLIQSAEYHALNPVWESGNNALLYMRSGPNVCEVRKAGINLQLELVSDILITKCAIHDATTSVTWGKDNDTVYFTDSTINSPYKSIYKYNVSSGKKTRIAIPDEKRLGKGFYYLTFNRITNQLIALSSQNNHSTIISVFNTEHELIAKRIVKKELKQVTSYKSQVVFLTQNNQLNALDTTTGKESVLMSPQAIDIKYPFVNSDGPHQLAFVTGKLKRRRLMVRNTEGELHSVNDNQNTRESAPVIDSESNLFFLSNNSGITQVWKKTTNNELIQITKFTHTIPIYSLTISPDSKFLALETQDGVQIYNLHTINYQPTPFITLSGATTPIFNISSILLVTKHLNGTRVLLPYDLKEEKYAEPLVSNVDFGFQHPASNHVFFIKQYESGLWMLDGIEVIKVFESAQISCANMLQITESGFIFSDHMNILYHFSLETLTAQSIGSIGPQEHFTYSEKNNELIFTQTLLGNANIHLAELN